jgi:putative heme-binding domain-containing protein
MSRALLVRSVGTFTGVWIALLALAAAAWGQAPPLAGASAADLASGKQNFDAQCAWCHGADGTGGAGPDLHRPQLRHAANDGELIDIVNNGIPGTEMPVFRFTEKARWQIAAYVRSLGRAGATEPAGNVQRGQAVYRANGCESCHIVSGEGTAVGPELTSIGALRGAPHLRQSIVDPEAAHPPGFLVITATTGDGQAVRGVRIDEDAFFVQIRDVRGTIHSLRKSQLATLERELRASLMPPFSQLTAPDLDDLVAYLASLRGVK